MRAQELFAKIKLGKYDADDPVWDLVSDAAKHLVVRLPLTYFEGLPVPQPGTSTSCIRAQGIYKSSTCVVPAQPARGEPLSELPKKRAGGVAILIVRIPQMQIALWSPDRLLGSQ